MSVRDDLLYFGHMLDTARKAREIGTRMTRAQFDLDDTSQLALTHLVQTIGEAARRVSPEGRSSHPEIPWKEIVGMRSRLVHDYTSVDLALLWEVITERLSLLIAALEQFVPPEPPC